MESTDLPPTPDRVVSLHHLNLFCSCATKVLGPAIFKLLLHDARRDYHSSRLLEIRDDVEDIHSLGYVAGTMLVLHTSAATALSSHEEPQALANLLAVKVARQCINVNIMCNTVKWNTQEGVPSKENVAALEAWKQRPTALKELLVGKRAVSAIRGLLANQGLVGMSTDGSFTATYEAVISDDESLMKSRATTRYFAISYVQTRNAADNCTKGMSLALQNEVDKALEFVAVNWPGNKQQEWGVWFDKLASRQFPHAQETWSASATLQYMAAPVLLLPPLLDSNYAQTPVFSAFPEFDELVNMSRLIIPGSCPEPIPVVHCMGMQRCWPAVEIRLAQASLGMYTTPTLYSALVYTHVAILIATGNVIRQVTLRDGVSGLRSDGQSVASEQPYFLIYRRWEALANDGVAFSGMLEMYSAVVENVIDQFSFANFSVEQLIEGAHALLDSAVFLQNALQHLLVLGNYNPRIVACPAGVYTQYQRRNLVHPSGSYSALEVLKRRLHMDYLDMTILHILSESLAAGELSRKPVFADGDKAIASLTLLDPVHAAKVISIDLAAQGFHPFRELLDPDLLSLVTSIASWRMKGGLWETGEHLLTQAPSISEVPVCWVGPFMRISERTEICGALQQLTLGMDKTSVRKLLLKIGCSELEHFNYDAETVWVADDNHNSTCARCLLKLGERRSQAPDTWLTLVRAEYSFDAMSNNIEQLARGGLGEFLVIEPTNTKPTLEGKKTHYNLVAHGLLDLDRRSGSGASCDLCGFAVHSYPLDYKGVHGTLVLSGPNGKLTRWNSQFLSSIEVGGRNECLHDTGILNNPFYPNASDAGARRDPREDVIGALFQLLFLKGMNSFKAKIWYWLSIKLDFKVVPIAMSSYIRRSWADMVTTKMQAIYGFLQDLFLVMVRGGILHMSRSVIGIATRTITLPTIMFGLANGDLEGFLAGRRPFSAQITFQETRAITHTQANNGDVLALDAPLMEVLPQQRRAPSFLSLASVHNQLPALQMTLVLVLLLASITAVDAAVTPNTFNILDWNTTIVDGVVALLLGIMWGLRTYYLTQSYKSDWAPHWGSLRNRAFYMSLVFVVVAVAVILMGWSIPKWRTTMQNTVAVAVGAMAVATAERRAQGPASAKLRALQCLLRMPYYRSGMVRNHGYGDNRITLFQECDNVFNTKNTCSERWHGAWDCLAIKSVVRGGGVTWRYYVKPGPINDHFFVGRQEVLEAAGSTSDDPIPYAAAYASVTAAYMLRPGLKQVLVGIATSVAAHSGRVTAALRSWRPAALARQLLGTEQLDHPLPVFDAPDLCWPIIRDTNAAIVLWAVCWLEDATRMGNIMKELAEQLAAAHADGRTWRPREEVNVMVQRAARTWLQAQGVDEAAMQQKVDGIV